MQSMSVSGLLGKSSNLAFGFGVAMGLGFTAAPAFAEDIGVQNTAPARRSAVRAPVSRRAAPTMPRPIQAQPASRRGQEQAVDLDALTATPSTPPSAPSAVPAVNPHSGAPGSARGASTTRSFHGSNAGGVIPNFKFYFDFLLRSWKGRSNESSFNFDSYHQRMLVEFTPTSTIQFQADLLGLSYFEVDYQASSRVQLRWGRIWIPFDDLSPHSVFGGRINTAEFQQVNGNVTESQFLPNIWADLGFGVKFTLADSSAYSSVLHAYIVNGFQDGGISPVQGEAGVVYYPDFGGTIGSTNDNNNAKAMGARLHQNFANRFGLGVSVYRDTFTPKLAPQPKSIFMLGGDIQLRPSNSTEIRLGYVTMKTGLVSEEGNPAPDKESMTRGGTYVELGQKMGFENRWKILLRAGTAQNDNRVVDISDKTIVGLTLLRNFGMIEAQATYHRDLKQIPSKVAYNYGAIRLVTAF